MAEAIFNPSWWIPTVILLAALAFLWLNRQRPDRLRLALGILAAMMIWLVLIWLVDTNLKQVQRRSRLLVQSVEKRDWDTMRDQLDDRVNFAIYHNRDDLVDATKMVADRYGLRSLHITSLRATQTGSVILVDMTVLSNFDILGRSNLSSWRLDWQQRGNRWSLMTITQLPDAENSQEIIEHDLPVPSGAR